MTTAKKQIRWTLSVTNLQTKLTMLCVESREFAASAPAFNPPNLHLVPPLGVTPFVFQRFSATENYMLSQKRIPPNHHRQFQQQCPIPVIFTACLQCSHCTRCTSYSNSVRLSVTRRYCVKTTARSMVQFELSDSKMCLVL